MLFETELLLSYMSWAVHNILLIYAVIKRNQSYMYTVLQGFSNYLLPGTLAVIYIPQPIVKILHSLF